MEEVDRRLTKEEEAVDIILAAVDTSSVEKKERMVGLKKKNRESLHSPRPHSARILLPSKTGNKLRHNFQPLDLPGVHAVVLRDDDLVPMSIQNQLTRQA